MACPECDKPDAYTRGVMLGCRATIEAMVMAGVIHPSFLTTIPDVMDGVLQIAKEVERRQGNEG